jgi:ribosome-binding factor A
MKARARSGASGRSQRQLRAGELVRHALVEILAREDLRDPDLLGVSVTISEVRASPDLKHMTVFVSALGAEDARTVATALTRCAGFLRSRLARVVTLKFTPDLHFLPDLSFEEARHIDELLESPEVARDLSKDTAPASPSMGEAAPEALEGVRPQRGKIGDGGANTPAVDASHRQLPHRGGAGRPAFDAQDDEA